MERFITLCGGVKVRYVESGEGSPVIIMHGWGCNSSTMALFERTAAEQHKVYNLDLPGFGGSDEPAGDWGVGEYTAMLEEFVSKLDIASPIIIGHSFGGRIGILYSSRNRVDKLILVDAAGVRPRRSLKYYFKIYSFKLAKRLCPLLLGRKMGADLIERMRSSRSSSDYAQASPVMRRVLSKSVNQDLRRYMPSISAPTLLIWGELDTATPLSDAKIMNKLIPDSGLVVFPGAGHFSFADNPYQSAAVVRRFINVTNSTID